jgi:hypothetical protein
VSLLSPGFQTNAGAGYAVSRSAAAGTAGADGHWTMPVVTSTLTVFGSLQPLSGRELQDLKVGQSAEDMRKFFTDQPMYTTDQGHAYQDIMTIADENGIAESYRVIRVKHHVVISGHFTVWLERMDVP